MEQVVFVNALNSRSSASQTITLSKAITSVSQMPQMQIPAAATSNSILGNRLMGHEVQPVTAIQTTTDSPAAVPSETKKDVGAVKKTSRLKIPGN